MALVTSTPPRHAGITVRETLLLALRAGGRSGDTDGVEADMELAGISGWADRRLDTLSDGMAQRVMVARAAIQSRQVLILDEPTAFLDVIGKEDVLLQLNRLRARAVTVILSTHDLRPWRPQARCPIGCTSIRAKARAAHCTWADSMPTLCGPCCGKRAVSLLPNLRQR